MHDFPAFFSHLTTEDQEQYLKLRAVIRPLTTRTSKDKLPKRFQEILQRVRDWTKGNNIRAAVCGVLWYDDKLAICTRQFRVLVDKCKSSINMGLELLGCRICQMTDSDVSALLKHFPWMKTSSTEIRQWTIRLKNDLPPPASEFESTSGDESSPESPVALLKQEWTVNDSETDLDYFFLSGNIWDDPFDYCN